MCTGTESLRLYAAVGGGSGNLKRSALADLFGSCLGLGMGGFFAGLFRGGGLGGVSSKL